MNVQVEPDATADAFLVAGLRSGRVPILMPGAEENLTWTFIPVECGFVRIPKILITDKRALEPVSEDAPKPVGQDEIGRAVRILDTRREWRDMDGREGGYGATTELEEILGGKVPDDGGMSDIGPILVLP